MTGVTELEWLKLAIYYVSYAYFVAAPALLWLMVRRTGIARLVALVVLGVLSCLAYGRFVEPRILRAPHTAIALDGCFEDAGAIRVAVASDIHEGLFANVMPVRRIAARINDEQPDLVLMPGDFTYFLSPETMEAAFAAFALIEPPVFGVLGNHDLGLPGPDLSQTLETVLPGAGVELIDDQTHLTDANGSAFELVGLSDDWAERQDLSLLLASGKEPRIVLTHNPATVHRFTEDMSADLLVGGHTHGGQIYLPWLTCALTSMCGARRYGLSRAAESYPGSHHEQMFVFTTSGTGMVGLPMRFRVPPRIDILNISWSACES